MVSAWIPKPGAGLVGERMRRTLAYLVVDVVDFS